MGPFLLMYSLFRFVVLALPLAVVYLTSLSKNFVLSSSLVSLSERGVARIVQDAHDDFCLAFRMRRRANALCASGEETAAGKKRYKETV